MMQFALILSGPMAVAPAPRCKAVRSITGTGLYDSDSGEILRPDYADIRAALPARYRRYVSDFPSCWFDSEARIVAGKCKGELPYIPICDSKGNRLATAYFAPVLDS
jgi:hypothetical protein